VRKKAKRKFVAVAQTSKKGAFGKGRKQTKKSPGLKVRGPKTLKSGKFLGGYE
jgi:hypothetical protein